MPNNIFATINPNPRGEHHHFPLMESQNNSGLLRFRSAPTSFLADLAEKSAHVMDINIDDNNSCNKGVSGNYTRFPAAMNSQLPPQYPRHQSGGGGGGGELGSLSVGGGGGGGGFGLVRQNSSPAGLLSQNGYAGVRNHTNFPSVTPSSSPLGLLSRIKEVENEHGGPHSPHYTKVGNSGGDNLFSTTSGFPFASWNDSSYFAETNFTSGIKTEVDNDPKPIFITENEELIRNRPYSLSHHLSLPKTNSSEIANMEKLLMLQDSVPCKIRAKRGCATHPRSIAERVRRTRISERMRKLQELVPNMDKQTNTADMLDLAVDYIKSLQKQYKILGDSRANCKCSASQKVILNQTH
ncbi:hypothetical protein ABFS82_10G168500 [Erythranthe guttata]|nr:PREDICTED: transcription factor bHLH130-like [Erythranthe guttata]|eukprot:XP_012834332.1 PREDICTED: transcription factor bHLH130-like [Erythranthe guttata]